MNAYLGTAIELVVGFTALLIFTKVIGKSQISQITPFDFISALILGELLGNAVYDQEVSVYRVLFATFIWGLLMYATTILTQKFKALRKPLEGEPSILIRKGKIQYPAMKKNKMDINQLQGMLRQKGCFSIRDAEYAILEADGSISVMKTSDKATPTRRDLSLPEREAALPVTLILDGELLYDNLLEAKRTELWLLEQLKQNGVDDVKDVLYAEWNPEAQGELYVQPYNRT